MTIREHLWKFYHDKNFRGFWILNDFLAFTSIIAVLLVVFETDSALLAQYPSIFFWIEIGVISLFTLDFFGHFLSEKKPMHYVFSIEGCIDLIAILPFYLLLPNLSVVKAFRLDRVLLFFRQLRFLKFFEVVKHTYTRQHIVRDIILFNIQVFSIFVASIVLIFGIIFYYLESGIPETAFHNIGDGVWFSLVTIASVGYGDITPITYAGKFFAGVLMILGLASFGVMVTIVGRTIQELVFGAHFQKEAELLNPKPHQKKKAL